MPPVVPGPFGVLRGAARCAGGVGRISPRDLLLSGSNRIARGATAAPDRALDTTLERALQMHRGPGLGRAQLSDARLGQLLLGRNDATRSERTLQVLAHGTDVRAPEQLRQARGIHGTLYQHFLRDATPGAELTAVVKKAGSQTAQEQFGFDLARILGIDDQVAAVVRRSNGDAYVEYVDGSELGAVGIRGVEKLREMQAQRYNEMGIEARDAAGLAQADTELVGVFDYLLANSDRNMRNAMVTHGGDLKLIDHGFAGIGAADATHQRIPRILATYQPVKHTQRHPAGFEVHDVELSQATHGLVRRIDPGDVTSAHARLIDSIPANRERVVRDPAFLDGVLERLDQLQQRGTYRFIR